MDIFLFVLAAGLINSVLATYGKVYNDDRNRRHTGNVFSNWWVQQGIWAALLIKIIVNYTGGLALPVFHEYVFFGLLFWLYIPVQLSGIRPNKYDVKYHMDNYPHMDRTTIIAQSWIALIVWLCILFVKF